MPEFRTLYGAEDLTAIVIVCNREAVQREGKCGHENRFTLGDAPRAMHSACQSCGDRLLDDRPGNREAQLVWGFLSGLQGMTKGQFPVTVKLEVTSESPHTAGS